MASVSTVCMVLSLFLVPAMATDSVPTGSRQYTNNRSPIVIPSEQHRGNSALIKSANSALNKSAIPQAEEKVPPPKKFTKTSAVISEYGTQVRQKLKPLFKSMGVEYPPAQQTWICLKKEKQLYIFAKDKNGKMQQLLSYPIIGASGGAGPKLKEGDKQVPEGFYKFDGFRPNVIAHLGLSVNYPNDEDRKHAKAEGRTNLGCDILVHGSRWSTGCLAMGNEPIEEMFVLAHDSGLESISLIFAPCNLLTSDSGLDLKKQPDWLAPLYKRLRTALSDCLPAK